MRHRPWLSNVRAHDTAHCAKHESFAQAAEDFNVPDLGFLNYLPASTCLSYWLASHTGLQLHPLYKQTPETVSGGCISYYG